MARVGGRNSAVAWFVTLLALGVIAALAWLAIPLLPAVAQWTERTASGAGAPAANADAAPTDAASAAPTTCRQLYTDAMWAGLNATAGASLAQDTSAPVTSATQLATALAPAVRMTCTWTAGKGVVSTTLGEVGSDAGSIATAALSSLGFSCATNGERTTCSRTADDSAEQIDVADGVWVSSSMVGWVPERYAPRVADAVFAP